MGIRIPACWCSAMMLPVVEAGQLLKDLTRGRPCNQTHHRVSDAAEVETHSSYSSVLTPAFCYTVPYQARPVGTVEGNRGDFTEAVGLLLHCFVPKSRSGSKHGAATATTPEKLGLPMCPVLTIGVYNQQLLFVCGAVLYPGQGARVYCSRSHVTAVRSRRGHHQPAAAGAQTRAVCPGTQQHHPRPCRASRTDLVVPAPRTGRLAERGRRPRGIVAPII